ncbi:MAG: DUF6443 domain-containing protein, partial [Prevotellaceae bacterium]|nr:DUF6443 domain-containing protein [Prevotellaceae bacterium]
MKRSNRIITLIQANNTTATKYKQPITSVNINTIAMKTLSHHMYKLLAIVFLLYSNFSYGQLEECLPLSRLPMEQYTGGINIDTIIGTQVILPGQSPQKIGTPSHILPVILCDGLPLSARIPIFRWYQSTNNGTSWYLVSGNNPWYDPSSASIIQQFTEDASKSSQTSLYRRWAGYILNGQEVGSYSNAVSITYVAELKGGTIACSAAQVNLGASITITSQTTASGGYGEISYHWEVKNDQGYWVPLNNGNSVSLQTSIYQTTHFRRAATCTIPLYYGLDNPGTGLTPVPGFKTDSTLLAIEPPSVIPQPNRLLPESDVITSYSNTITIQTIGSSSPNPDPNSYTFSADRNYILTYTPQVASTDISQVEKKKRGPTVVYYDGLGRPMQEIAVVASPQYHDIITPISYDYVGRQDKDHLPYVAGSAHGQYRTSDITTQQSYYTSLYGAADGAHAASRRVYEPSPLNRVEKEFLPGGEAYQTDARAVKHTYTANASGEVKLWKVSGNTLSQSGTYPAGTLYVQETVDPDGRITRTYTDLQGQTVETRQLNPARTETLTTSYVYDAWGRLRVVIPPKAQALAVNSDELNQLLYRYTYDDRGRCIEKKLPGSEPIYYVYDKADRLVLSQDGNQRLVNEWSATKYDKLGRVIITGVITTASSHSQLQLQYKNAIVKEKYLSTTSHGFQYGYSYNHPPNIPIDSILAVSYYDNDTIYLYHNYPQLRHTPNSGYAAPHGNTTGQLIGTII